MSRRWCPNEWGLGEEESFTELEFARTESGRVSRAKEGCSNCEKRLQVNLSVGLLVVLGERRL